MKRNQEWMLVVAVLFVFGCAKEESHVTAESSVVEEARSVVNVTGDALRNVVKGVNDAVYGGQK